MQAFFPMITQKRRLAEPDSLFLHQLPEVFLFPVDFQASFQAFPCDAFPLKLLIQPVIRASVFIQQHIPVHPRAHPVIQIPYDIMGIGLSRLPRQLLSPLALFGGNKKLFRIQAVENIQRSKMITGIPVNRHAVKGRS